MIVAQPPRHFGGRSEVVRLLRNMNSALVTAEDWEERVGYVLGLLHHFVPLELAVVLLADHEMRFLVHLHSPLERGLVEKVKANVVEHYRLFTEQQVAAEPLPTSFLGPLTPVEAPADHPNGQGSGRRGSYLSLPMLGVDQIMGVIHIFSSKPDAYDEEELNEFSLVAVKLGSYLAHVSRHRSMERYEQERDAFTAEVIHELKNPLTSASGFAQLLLRFMSAPEPADKAKERTMVERVQQQLRRVLELADTALDATRVRAGWMSLEMEPVDLGLLAGRVAELVGVTTDKHSIAVAVEGECVVRGDEKRLEQVLRNLLSNAVKYSPKGGPVEVKVVRGDLHGQVTVAVRDEGMGIAREQQQHLFERYYRADSLTRHRVGGTGLGLYISSQIVRRHGGRIELESEEGKGSTFSFTLPAVEQPQ